jgi:hypothetical protein
MGQLDPLLGHVQTWVQVVRAANVTRKTWIGPGMTNCGA